MKHFWTILLGRILKYRNKTDKGNNMKGQLYYIVGKPDELKHQIFTKIKSSTNDSNNILFAKTFTTNKALSEDENYCLLDERDYHLRNSMGLYCLSWEKNQNYYGISGEVDLILNKGINVVINGSMRNIKQVMNEYPGTNVVMIQKGQTNSKSVEQNNTFPLKDGLGVNIEWIDHFQGVCCPYVMNIESDDDIGAAADLFVKLINYNGIYLASAV